MPNSQPDPSAEPSGDLHTAEEIAAYLKVDPKTVLNWAKSGKIPEAFRVGRTVRFSLDAVKGSLNVNNLGEGRYVELVVMALSLVFGSNFPRIPKVDLGSITVDEMEQLKNLCTAYAADLDTLNTPQECFAYAEGVLEAARIRKEVGEILGRSPDRIRETDRFVRDLSADSLDTVEIVMAVEEVFDIAIADADAEKLITVGDLIDYVCAKTKALPGNPAKPPYEMKEVYMSMRGMVLNLDATQIGELKDKPVWAVLMETGYPEAAATLVAVADGTASLYFSNGGGMIGAGEHASVRPASLGLVKMAEDYLGDMTKVEAFPTVTPGNTTFYVVTPNGVYTRTAKEDDLGEKRDKLSKLFYQGQELITRMRLAEEKREAGD